MLRANRSDYRLLYCDLSTITNLMIAKQQWSTSLSFCSPDYLYKNRSLQCERRPRTPYMSVSSRKCTRAPKFVINSSSLSLLIIHSANVSKYTATLAALSLHILHAYLHAEHMERNELSWEKVIEGIDSSPINLVHPSRRLYVFSLNFWSHRTVSDAQRLFSWPTSMSSALFTIVSGCAAS